MYQSTTGRLRCVKRSLKCYPGALIHVPDRLKAVKMSESAIEADPWQLYYTPNCLKTQKMCGDVVQRDPYSLLGVPDYFVTSQGINI